MDNLIVQSRAALLDALEALQEHRDNVIVVGAQAVYLRTGNASVAIAEATKDSDLALDPRELSAEPKLEEAMKASGFHLNVDTNQPGAWVSSSNIPVDLMVPDALSNARGQTRGARIHPHSSKATRRTVGLEACIVDNDELPIPALDSSDTRAYMARVAGVAALMVAKIYKIHERLDQPHRLNNKDAHDVYRMLQASDDMAAVGETFRRLLGDPLSASVTEQAVEWIPGLFADGPDAVGSTMAGQAEIGVGDPDFVAAAIALLAADLLTAIAG